jgi:hypothetical protein
MHFFPPLTRSYHRNDRNFTVTVPSDTRSHCFQVVHGRVVAQPYPAWPWPYTVRLPALWNMLLRVNWGWHQHKYQTSRVSSIQNRYTLLIKTVVVRKSGQTLFTQSYFPLRRVLSTHRWKFEQHHLIIGSDNTCVIGRTVVCPNQECWLTETWGSEGCELYFWFNL